MRPIVLSNVEQPRTGRGRGSRFGAGFGVILGLLSAGCGDDSDGDPGDGALVRASDWAVVEEDDDPFLSERDADAECDPLGYAAEVYEGEMAFFVETAVCDYLTVGQAARLSVAAGDTLHLRVLHYELSAAEPGEAYLALAIDGEKIWDETVEIPKEAELFDVTFSAERAFAAGDLVVFHVHNHGDNNYVMLELSKE
jgi:hypothetical protein